MVPPGFGPGAALPEVVTHLRFSNFTVTLNGQKTVDGAQDAKFASGRIALQHGLGVKDDKGVANDKGVVKFRKVEIKPL